MERPWYGSKEREGRSAEIDRPLFRPLSVRHVSTSLSTSFLALETDMARFLTDYTSADFALYF